MVASEPPGFSIRNCCAARRGSRRTQRRRLGRRAAHRLGSLIPSAPHAAAPRIALSPELLRVLLVAAAGLLAGLVSLARELLAAVDRTEVVAHAVLGVQPPVEEGVVEGADVPKSTFAEHDR